MSFRFALRQLLKHRGVTAIALLALALGIGANTAIFSVVEAVMLRPLPYHQPDRLVSVLMPDAVSLGSEDYIDIRKSSRAFESAGAAELWSGSLTGRDAPQEIVGMRVTEDLFHVLGRSAIRGRTLDASDFAPNAERALVIGYSLWQRTFGGAGDVVGKKVVIDNAAFTIVGVMPPDFYFAPFWVTQAEMWTADDLQKSNTHRGGGSLRMFARLAPGVERAQAQADMNRIAANLAAAYPDSDAGMSLVVASLPEQASRRIRPILEVLLGVVGMVLLIACANVANLALARATARRREVAVRTALGAGRWDIARQFLTESLMLSLAGGTLGVLLAAWGIRILQSMMRPETGEWSSRMVQADQISLDPYVLAFTLALSILTGVLFGLAPAFLENRNAGSTMASTMKEGERGSTAAGSRLHAVLVAAEIAVAIVLLIGAGLLLRSFSKLRAVDPGFDAHNLATMTVSVAGRSDYVGAARDVLYREILDHVSSIPGVERAATTNHIPIAGDQWGFGYFVEGEPPPQPGKGSGAVYRSSRPGYFATMRTPILAGRDFNDRDTADAPAVVIINQRLARAHFGSANPLGHRISFSDPRRDPKWMTIVGVVRDIAQEWGAPADPELYVPYWQDPRLTKTTEPYAAYMTLIVRTRGDAEAALDSIKNAVWSVDRNLPLSHAQTMEHAAGSSTFESRFALTLVGLFAGLALILAMIGIYGVMAFEVAQRTHEIGIRMALGAARGKILQMVARQNAPVAIAGIVCGLAAAAGLSRLMRTLLYQVETLDAATFAIVPLVMLTVAIVAALIPARAAMRVDPAIALRRD